MNTKKQIFRNSSGLANLFLRKFACQEMTLEKVKAGEEREVKDFFLRRVFFANTVLNM
jgi:hypothetical protein